MHAVLLIERLRAQTHVGRMRDGRYGSNRHSVPEKGLIGLLVRFIMVDVLWHTHTAPAHAARTLTVICIHSQTCRGNAAAQALQNFA